MTDTQPIDITPFLSEIYKRVPYCPDIGIVCGSGLSNIASKLKNPITIQYEELGSTFPHSAVPGHKNEIVCGELGSKKVVCFRGRFHLYEGWTPQENTLGIRIMAALGVKFILITNAAGGLDPSYQMGDVMVLDGHINFPGLVGNNPLVGPNNGAEGPRFPAINAYEESLNKHFTDRYSAVSKAQNHSHVLRHGVYVGLSGPSYESRHEIQMFRTLGAHAVGMSTTNEILMASHIGVKVLGLSLITNSAIGTLPEDFTKPTPTHEEVVEETAKVEGFLQLLIQDFIDTVDISNLKSSHLATLYAKDTLTSVATSPAKNSTAVIEANGCCTLKCPINGKSGGSCPVMWSMVGGVVGALVGAGLTLAYATSSMNSNKQYK